MSSKRTKCNRCNASRGLAEYPDGTYCYACHFKDRRKNLYQIKKYRKNQYNKPTSEIITSDWLEYLQQYHITLEDLVRYKIGCTFDSGLAVNFMEKCQWIRYKNKDKMKWMFYGWEDVRQWVIWTGDHDKDKILCVVEDPISAIRVGKHIATLLLGGTYLDVKNHSELLNNFNKIILWLDGDKAGQDAAMKIWKELKLKHGVINIYTKKDPKCYTDKEIKGILNNTFEWMYND